MMLVLIGLAVWFGAGAVILGFMMVATGGRGGASEPDRPPADARAHRRCYTIA
jgi:hypothetical protein